MRSADSEWRSIRKRFPTVLLANDGLETLVDTDDQGTKGTAIFANKGASSGTGVGGIDECNCNDGDGR